MTTKSNRFHHHHHHHHHDYSNIINDSRSFHSMMTIIVVALTSSFFLTTDGGFKCGWDHLIPNYYSDCHPFPLRLSLLFQSSKSSRSWLVSASFVATRGAAATATTTPKSRTFHDSVSFIRQQRRRSQPPPSRYHDVITLFRAQQRQDDTQNKDLTIRQETKSATQPSVKKNKTNQTTTTSSSSSSVLSSHPYQKPLQQRLNTASTRKPRNYWSNVQNMEHELRNQWEVALKWNPASSDEGRRQQLAALLPPDLPPPIPNDTLLNHWRRHDVKTAIQKWYLGDRAHLSETLGGAVIVPGKWSRAAELPIVRCAIELDGTLSMGRPPTSHQHVQRMQRLYNMTTQEIDAWKHQRPSSPSQQKQQQRWKYKTNIRRKPYGYWTKETIVQELYNYLQERKRTQNIPSTWMPRLNHLDEYNNRTGGGLGLRLAIQKQFGSSKKLCHYAGLIPYREWMYIERQYDLLISLKQYLDETSDGDYKIFPRYVQLLQNNNNTNTTRLFRLIQDYGGQRFVAARLGMSLPSSNSKNGGGQSRRRKKGDDDDDYGGGSSSVVDGLNWGPFDLEFAIALMDYVRRRQMEQDPPLGHPMIFMPTRTELLSQQQQNRPAANESNDDDDDHERRRDSAVYLDKKIIEYGGYENVARRLGLEYFVPKQKRL